MNSNEAKEIWASKAGGSLMKAMLGLKSLDKQDVLTIKRLKQLDKALTLTNQRKNIPKNTI